MSQDKVINVDFTKKRRTANHETQLRNETEAEIKSLQTKIAFAIAQYRSSDDIA